VSLTVAHYIRMLLTDCTILRATAAAPKPNTRFLRNILRETDSHNEAILAKEHREARARQKASAKREDGRLTPPIEQVRRPSKTHSRNDHEELKKGRRLEDPDGDRGSKRRRIGSHERSKSSKWSSQDKTYHSSRTRGSKQDSDRDVADQSLYPAQDRSRDLREQRRLRDRHERNDRKGDHSHRYDSYSELSSRPSSPERHRKRHKSSRKRISSPIECSPRSLSPENKTAKFQALSIKKSRLQDTVHSPVASDSDPLEAIVGPPPPPPEPKVIKRGRGAFASSATIDSHFSSRYDPAVDVRPNSDEEDDWDQALEAHRDRQKWKQQGAERLRSAGFTETEVKKWEKGGEKDESDVKWAKLGEGREWDRGKLVDSDGDVELKPEWGRLKGT